jgi:hypothetical protein
MLQLVCAFIQKEFSGAQVAQALNLIGDVLVQVGCVQLGMDRLVKHLFAVGGDDHFG